MGSRGYLGSFGALAVVVLVVAVISGSASFPGSARAFVETYTWDGFDQCEAATTSDMSTWWQDSPFFYTGIYIGGDNRACANSRLTASWITTVRGQGWAFLPIWVGLQDPCWSGGSRTFSTDTSTAQTQGESAADNAVAAATNLGFGSPAVIYYDLEAYTQKTTCINAAHWFIRGWDHELTIDGFQPGVYGGPASSNLSDLNTLVYPVADAWAASWNSSDNVWGLSGLSNSAWADDHRLHQYVGGHNETYGGVTFNIDTDCSLGEEDKATPVYDEGYLYDTGSTNESNGSSEDPTCAR